MPIQKSGKELEETAWQTYRQAALHDHTRRSLRKREFVAGFWSGYAMGRAEALEESRRAAAGSLLRRSS